MSIIIEKFEKLHKLTITKQSQLKIVKLFT